MQYKEQVAWIASKMRQLAKEVYPGDQEINQGVKHLLRELRKAEQNEEFTEALIGYYQYAISKKVRTQSILTTFFHDLGEFSMNRHRNWFCPRSGGYRQYFNPKNL